ncbi:YhbY family RNA-binding protein [Candidatus Woesearchaeota archaeon]|nr:YhbY family RNA-binding protein [Candidatus Woesearchaeota archaeon]MBW2994199.1 YhbY family RNA-binding protein [Candidatus Woesearchaeota archaeon]
MDIKQKKAKANTMFPCMQIGKSGITQGLIRELQKQLKIKKLIKIKLMKSFIEDKDKKEIAKELARKTGADLISQVGFVVVLGKKEKAKNKTPEKGK